MSDSDSGISAFPEKDTIMCWKGIITGGQGSVFEGKQYKLSLNFPNDYPFKPPCVKFDYPIPFHPNVDVSGKIYLDILLQVLVTNVHLFIYHLDSSMFLFTCIWSSNLIYLNQLKDESNKWSSAYDVRTVLLSIKSLLDGNHFLFTRLYLHCVKLICQYLQIQT